MIWRFSEFGTLIKQHFKFNKMTYYDKLPLEIQERMLLEQEKQGNGRNPDTFRKNIRSGVSDEGFTWEETEDGFDFWEDILVERYFDVFFEKYPKEEELLKKDTKTYPRIMEVSDSENFYNPQIRVVFMEKNGKYLAWRDANTVEEAEKVLTTTSWAYAREVDPIVELTAEDISAGKGVGINPKLIRFKE